MKQLFTVIMAAVFATTACNQNASADQQQEATASPKIKEEGVMYNADTLQLKGYVTYNEMQEGKRPGILIVHEWWGLTEYPRNRAKQLAEMGYVAMAIDMYGNGQTVETPQEAQTLAMPFYQNPALTKTRLDAALAKLKTYPQVDTANIAAIGYCFGGFVVLNAAKQGAALNGVVSFHGNLSGVQPSKDLLTANILVSHGGADNFVPDTEVAAFRKSMDSIGAKYTFKVYPGATHAFTNPKADEKAAKFNMPIQYNAAADSASWNDMKTFFSTIFPGK